MGSASHVEVVFSDVLGEVFVAGDSGCLKGFRGNLFNLIGNNMNNKRESSDWGLLITNIIDSDLGVGHTTIVS